MLWDCKDVKKKLTMQLRHQDLPLLSTSCRLVNRIALQAIGYWYGAQTTVHFASERIAAWIRTHNCSESKWLLL